jgi:asparagine synthase (glutamine-hydrolysing)
MSGIGAMYHLNGRPVEPQMLTRLWQASAHRGGDSAGMWTEGPVWLGAQVLAITPEASGERQPVVDEQGRYRLVWDGRLDNRNTLLEQLIGATDPELVLAAYQRWGVDCPQYLLGEFAFILWDTSSHRLFCARDRLGLRPLHYCVSRGAVLLSSEIRPILSVLDHLPEPEDEMILGFLLREFRQEDRQNTFFQDIHRVPPGSCLLVERGVTQIHPYWQIDPTRRIRYVRDEEYVEHFRALFEQVIRAHVRSRSPIACFLSGGMDSSSVTCVAARHAAVSVEAITVVGDDAASDERVFAAAVADPLGIPLHVFARGRDEPLDGLAQALWQVESPFAGTNRRVARELMAFARARGCRTLLSGIGGDQLLDEYGYMADVLKHKPWQFVGQARRFAAWCGMKPQDVFPMALEQLVPARLKYWGKRMLRGVPMSRRRRREHVNTVSAQVILDSYLESRRKK